jgi:hypothetical protein
MTDEQFLAEENERLSNNITRLMADADAHQREARKWIRVSVFTVLVVVIVGICTSWSRRLESCAKAVEVEPCRDFVDVVGFFSTECAHPDHTLTLDGSRAICACPRPSK